MKVIYQICDTSGVWKNDFHPSQFDSKERAVERVEEILTSGRINLNGKQERPPNGLTIKEIYVK